jgi:hypothetical protein
MPEGSCPSRRKLERVRPAEKQPYETTPEQGEDSRCSDTFDSVQLCAGFGSRR